MTMAREVEIYRAQGVPGVDAVDEVAIHIRHEMPNIEPDKARAFFASEGAALAEAIWVACPGGTVEMLIRALQARQAAANRGD
jgi:hypothetical protein